MPSEDFPCQAQGADVDVWRQTAASGRHDRLEPSRVAERADQIAAGLINVVVIVFVADVLLGPLREPDGKPPVPISEKRPCEMRQVHHDGPTFASGLCRAAWRSLKRCIFPVAVFGSSSTNSIQRGYFQGPMLRLTWALRPS